jgi:mono/diheme cytochrome c family protein
MRAPVGAILAGFLLAVAACGPASSGSAPPAAAPPAESGRNVGARQRSAAPVTGVQDEALVSRGKVIFEKTAGGVGCAFCHGVDGRGKAELASPNIRGKTPQDVLNAMETRAQMNIVKLSDEDVQAVGAYLVVLASTP